MENLRQFITQMHESMVTGHEIAEEVIKKHKRKNYEAVEVDLQIIKNGFTKHKKLAEEMKSEVVQFENEVNEDRNRITRLEAWLINLQREVDSLKTKNKNLNIAQITNNFEFDLAAHIYPPDTKVTFSPIFPNLLLWLEENKEKPEGVEGNRKWHAFVKRFNWSEEHEKVFYKMIKFTKEINHENVDFHTRFTNKEKLYVDDICEMSKRLN